MDLDLAQVRAFVVTAQRQSFSRAAEQLFLTQQALSKRIRRLEEALSVQLFLRTGRATELTEQGARFLPHAVELLRVAEAAVAALDGAARPLRLDLIDSRLSPMFMLRRMAERDPELRIERSQLRGLANALGPLLHGELDLAFGRVRDLGRELPAELEHRLIRLEPLVALLPPEHPLAAGEVVRMTDLRAEGIWLPSLAGPVEWLAYLRRMSESLGVPLDESGVSYDLRHTLEQTRYGRQRVTLAGADMELAADLNLRVLPFEPAPLFPWSVVWHRDNRHPGLARLLALAGQTSRAESWCDYDPARNWVPADEPVTAGGSGTTR
ncbi:LysR family transcriptional regulator [Amycolatopsis aidingensis]|uniref:LysR family transcriptional regulator n=1 Tax=Amycolatopsis aidingensis TaxID=2842453 RepID=UPI001C0E655C|nr:LysR family transcriptional regulator [Amycolatopsis aidingensis]